MAEDASLQAIRTLEEKAAEIRRKAEEEAGELERTANLLRKNLNLPLKTKAKSTAIHTKASTPAVSDSEFRGMTKSTALEVYIRRRKGEKISLRDAVQDLTAAGCYLGDDTDRWERNLMAVARNRPQVFGYDPERRLIWLADTAHNEPPNRYERDRQRVLKRPSERTTRKVG